MAKRFDRKHIEIADDLIKYKKKISVQYEPAL